jgi:glycosyltransferase involved in cell wall biosynthesis
MVHYLSDVFEFYIVTKDRDAGDHEPYPSITVGVWQKVGKANVLYASDSTWNLSGLRSIIINTNYDLVYLNSLFAHISIVYLLLRRLKLIPNKPVILAPRGETDPGAIALKSVKKRIYLGFTKLIGFYHRILWHASSALEEDAIVRIFDKALIHIAPNLSLPPKVNEYAGLREKSRGSVKLLYLSRITPKKNLVFALKCLSKIEYPITFDIYGPISDEDYWQMCQSIIGQLPAHISIKYCGSVANQSVVDTMAKYHALYLPTQGENFGHVFIEAFVAGCLVVTSDQTPWRNLQNTGIGWDIPLEDTKGFEKALRQLVEMDDDEFQSCSRAAQAFAERYLQDSTVLEMNRQLFLKVALANVGET